MGNARARKVPAQLVEDEDYQLRHERVAGIDVAKAKADVCTRLPPQRDGGRRASRVEEVPARAREIVDLAARLITDGVELVVMESTSDYWRIWFYLLEAAGLNVQLVNSSHARQLAGRPKTDRLDAQWIARLAEMGLLRPSFVPPPEIRGARAPGRPRTAPRSPRPATTAAPHLISAPRDGPSTNCITIHGAPSCSTTSWTVITPGWSRPPAARASRIVRAISSARSPAYRSGSSTTSFAATARSTIGS